MFTVLVTRPQPQADILSAELKAQGFNPLSLPVIEIQYLDNKPLDLSTFDIAIFVSAHAVKGSKITQIPSSLQCIAVGEATAQALKESHMVVHAYPKEEWNSEAVLELPELQNISGKKIILFCGKEGRELLENTVQERGGILTKCICYERVFPIINVEAYVREFHKTKIHATIASSVQVLENLVRLFSESVDSTLKNTPLVVTSARIMMRAKELGFKDCFLAKNASNASIIETLKIIRKESMSSTSPILRNILAAFIAVILLGLTGIAGAAFWRVFHLQHEITASLSQFSQEIETHQIRAEDVQSTIKSLQEKVDAQEKFAEQWKFAQSTPQMEYGHIINAQQNVSLAYDALLTSGDVAVASHLLKNAQVSLNKTSDPKIIPLKKALEEDIATLRNTSWMNTSDIFQRLANLQKQVEALPLLLVPVQEPEALASENEQGWRKGLRESWKAIRQVVVVYKLPSTNTPPFITPDQRPFILQNLHAVLNNAIWGVLQQEVSVYHESLDQALAWVKAYFAASEPKTENFLTELNTLQSLTFSSPKKVNLLSPIAFQDYFKNESGGG